MFIHLQPRVERYTSLTYEPSSTPIHMPSEQLFLSCIPWVFRGSLWGFGFQVSSLPPLNPSTTHSCRPPPRLGVLGFGGGLSETQNLKPKPETPGLEFRISIGLRGRPARGGGFGSRVSGLCSLVSINSETKSAQADQIDQLKVTETQPEADLGRDAVTVRRDPRANLRGRNPAGNTRSRRAYSPDPTALTRPLRCRANVAHIRQ